jgi:hypothetical protein
MTPLTQHLGLTILALALCLWEWLAVESGANPRALGSWLKFLFKLLEQLTLVI